IAKAFVIGESLKNLFFRPGVDSGVKLHNIIKKLTENKKFGEEMIPFACNSVDLVTHSHIIHREGTIADAIRASMSVPGFFHPFRMNGMLLVDGGIHDNMPVCIPRRSGIKNVIAVNLNSNEPEKIEKFETGMDVIVESLFINSRISEKTKENTPTIEILANDGRTNTDMKDPAVSIEFGYKKAKEMSEQIFNVTTPAIKNIFRKKTV
ncbi:MAG TPA: patatin-like phospholipase family protein, partial [bacterium]|nr:patatin-like phospholipase family protein [bacterium]